MDPLLRSYRHCAAPYSVLKVRYIARPEEPYVIDELIRRDRALAKELSHSFGETENGEVILIPVDTIPDQTITSCDPATHSIEFIPADKHKILAVYPQRADLGSVVRAMRTATTNGWIPCLKVLLERYGSDKRVADDVYLWGAETGQLEVMEIASAHGLSDPTNVMDYAYAFAAQNGNKHVVIELSKKIFNMGRDMPLMYALRALAVSGNMTCLEKLRVLATDLIGSAILAIELRHVFYTAVSCGHGKLATEIMSWLAELGHALTRDELSQAMYNAAEKKANDVLPYLKKEFDLFVSEKDYDDALDRNFPEEYNRLMATAARYGNLEAVKIANDWGAYKYEWGMALSSSGTHKHPNCYAYLKSRLDERPWMDYGVGRYHCCLSGDPPQNNDAYSY